VYPSLGEVKAASTLLCPLSRGNFITGKPMPKSESRLPDDRRSFGQSVLVSDHYLGRAINFSLSSLGIIFRHARFIIWGGLSDDRASL
jgi:hypothetical protein